MEICLMKKIEWKKMEDQLLCITGFVCVYDRSIYIYIKLFIINNRWIIYQGLANDVIITENGQHLEVLFVEQWICILYSGFKLIQNDQSRLLKRE